ncbi:uncharacterized protein LOC125075564 [Vanessa atalanta]|uniref:uncharacterized protein LOC125075564 n=1 Tax=Vanessa atalanta TaxID=42275 RepID=UPI001FCD32E3|nr:uncharacterized protein LOC125075564 [Vanessa atalanta]
MTCENVIKLFISNNSLFKCHFGCKNDGPLHRFPKPQYPYLEKFNVWKSVLAEDIQDKGDIYIYNQIRICYRHFEECYCSQSHRLTANAVPTLNIGSSQLQPMETDVIEHVLNVMQPSTALKTKDDQGEGSSFRLHCMETDVFEHVLTVIQPSTSALSIKDNNLAKQEHKILPAECEETADFLLIMDKLFDSFNGHSYQELDSGQWSPHLLSLTGRLSSAA